MKKKLSVKLAAAATALVTLAPPALSAQQTDIELRPGLVITSSVRVVPKLYRLPASASLDSPLIVIRGDNITVDFAGATLVGTDPAAPPDEARGLAIRIDGGAAVELRNARVRGYHVGLLARGTRGLTLVDNDFSFNWKPRLFSLIEHESLVDWLSHHKNDSDEWLRFGAGVYLSDVRGGEIRGNRIEQGMEGLMVVRSDSLRIWNNVIAFNSGVGIGLYRSSDNTIMHNHGSYNVRGYSHGFYRRGQDSADLLLYEQSSRNIVAFNSMTHGGDGLFLWAGQSTMDTGQGGSNDNIFFANDFSYAPTNAMEATFSRNTFIANLAVGSEYGLWGGYSFESKILGNDFRFNRTGVAIEHGQHNVIGANRFIGDSVAINLWANPIEPSDWGYPKHRDTRSGNYRIDTNIFFGNRVAIRGANTRELAIMRSQLLSVDSAFVLRDTSAVQLLNNDTTALRDPRGDEWPPMPAHRTLDPILILPQRLRGGLDLRDDSLAQRDRSAIIVDDWGPYDWRSPKLWPVGSPHTLPVRLQVLGPPGAWRVASRRGIDLLSQESGGVGDTITVIPTAGTAIDWELALEYRGAATQSPRGEKRAVGEPYAFTYGGFQPVSNWNVAFFEWPDSADPRAQPAAFNRLVRGRPLLTQQTPRLDYMWYRPNIAGVPLAKFAVVATATVTLGPGEYTLRSISDDGVRVWVDNRLVIDHWTPHDSRVDNAPITPGRHELRVEYYQVDGWTELRVEVVRGVLRSIGSPGPH